jgi:hypothetical protein
MVAVLLVASGCADFPKPPPPGDEPAGRAPAASMSSWEWLVDAQEVQSLLAYAERMQAANAEDMRQEYAAVNQSFNRDRTESTRLKLVLLLSLPNAPVRDDARLLNLLETSLSHTQPPEAPRHQLVTLLMRLSAERIRHVGALRDELKKVDAQAKDEQRREEEEHKRTDELQKRADELQSKLDKLLAIDREMRRSPRRMPR